MKNSGLHVPARQEVLLRGSGAAGVSDERKPIDARARQRTRHLHQSLEELHGFRILTGPQGWNLRARNRRYLIHASAAAAGKPACGHGDDATARQLVGPFHVLPCEPVRAVQNENRRKGTRARRSCDCRLHIFGCC